MEAENHYFFLGGGFILLPKSEHCLAAQKGGLPYKSGKPANALLQLSVKDEETKPAEGGGPR